MTKNVEITEYADCGNGRNRGFSVRGVRVLVSPQSAESDAEAAVVAESLAAAARGVDARMTAAELERDEATRRLREAERRIAALETRVPPASPARLLGPGCVRFDEQGRLWLLNKREKGWSSWGVICDGWDDLFRRYAVRITAHGTDEHGPWWTATPEPR